MKEGNLPQIINNFHIYKGADDANSMLLGVTGEVTLPDLNAMIETLTGSGFLGELEVNNPGHYSAMNMELPFISLCGDMMGLDPVNYNLLTLRACEQSRVKATREFIREQIKIVIGGNAKDFKLGTVKIGGQMGSSVTMALDYIKIVVDNAVALELDKIGEVFIKDGVDMLAEIKAMC